MTYQAYFLLRQIRKVQLSENGRVLIDPDTKLLQTYEGPSDKSRGIDLSKKWSSVPSTLQYLVDNGYATVKVHRYYKLTHAGYHYTQTIISSVCSFLIKSIGVPIGVSILTTLITLVLFGTI